MLECFDSQYHTDCALMIHKSTPVTELNQLQLFNGKEVSIIADDIILDKQTITNGTIHISHPAKDFEIGLPFTHMVAPLPPVVACSSGAAPIACSRLVRAVFRVIDTRSLEIDTGTGIHQEMVPSLSDYKLDSTTPTNTQDIVIRSLGWTRSPTEPLWEIRGDTPRPFKLVSVTTDIKLGG